MLAVRRRWGVDASGALQANASSVYRYLAQPNRTERHAKPASAMRKLKNGSAANAVRPALPVRRYSQQQRLGLTPMAREHAYTAAACR